MSRVSDCGMSLHDTLWYTGRARNLIGCFRSRALAGALSLVSRNCTKSRLAGYTIRGRIFQGSNPKGRNPAKFSSAGPEPEPENGAGYPSGTGLCTGYQVGWRRDSRPLRPGFASVGQLHPPPNKKPCYDPVHRQQSKLHTSQAPVQADVHFCLCGKNKYDVFSSFRPKRNSIFLRRRYEEFSIINVDRCLL
jgi:hypothetical protein